ncbi:MAG: hypothetical protein HC929_04860 [Leptolyngbyaceae cyanobacterium SM2_5_2]|nr:hypothetical protein [Leptolyngbyaceae cyanobacterium SM2_5_2]
MAITMANLPQWLKLSLLGLFLALLPLLGLPALAQDLDTEPVFLDGLFLFDVPAAGDLTAPERARAIETNLAPLIAPGELNEVQLEARFFAPGE